MRAKKVYDFLTKKDFYLASLKFLKNSVWFDVRPLKFNSSLTCGSSVRYRGFTKKNNLAKVWAPFNRLFAGGQRPKAKVMKESHENILCSSPQLISQLTGAPSRNAALDRRIPSQARCSAGDTNKTFASQQFM